MGISERLIQLENLRKDLNDALKLSGKTDKDNVSLSELIPLVSTEPSAPAPIEKVLYSFGVVSDIHLKDPQFGEDEAESVNDYRKALTFFGNSGVDMVCIPGDIVALTRASDGSESEDAPEEWLSEITMFAGINNELMPGKVYATTGNHDSNINGYADGGGPGLDEVVTAYGDGTKTAYEVWTELVGQEPTMVFEHGNDVFLFLAGFYYYYVDFVKDEHIQWLSDTLEQYKDRRVFFFMHLNLPNTFAYGNATGLLPNAAGTGNASRFKALAEKYPNVIWFSGHTHIDLAHELDVENANVYQSGDSMTMIHVPSCAFIRRVRESGAIYRVYEGTQGLLVDVYAKKIVVKGVDFSVGGGAFVPSANYVINTV